MEEFIDGTICSYDAIIDGAGQPVFETGNVTPGSLMDVVNEREESCFYIVKELPDEVRAKGRAAVKSNSADVYEIWADMIAGIQPQSGNAEKSFCAFIGRRNGRAYALSHEEILKKYGAHLREYGEVDAALAPAMGDYRYIACFATESEVYAFFKDLSR